VDSAISSARIELAETLVDAGGRLTPRSSKPFAVVWLVTTRPIATDCFLHRTWSRVLLSIRRGLEPRGVARDNCCPCHAGKVTGRDWATIFNDAFAAPSSPVAARIWSEVFGDEYPANLDIYSFVSTSELNRFVAELRLSPGEVLADVGCGRGGPGLWVAAKTGARLIGIDIAETALNTARDRALALGIAERAEFHRGSFQDTGLSNSSINAVMSIDALLFAPDKLAAIRELARILVHHGRLVVTTWDYWRQPVGRPPQVPDHRPILEEAGFDVLAYDETTAWLQRQTRIGELMLLTVGELAAETGSDPAQVRQGVEEMHARLACMTRRVLFVAEHV
jgi:SAM-dependent methyltransferase